MRCNNKGQMAGWEAIIILVLLGSTAYAFFLYAKKPSEANVYATGSRPVIYEVKPSFGGCASFGAQQVREDKDANINKTSR